MKILVLFTFLVSQVLIGQDTAIYKKTTKAFQENLNNQNIDEVYNLYAPDMQKEMTKEGITKFVQGVHKQFGNLLTLDFIKEADGIYSYTATFEQISLVMEVLLNTDGKIETIQFQEP